MGTSLGDVNLDGLFNSRDIVLVFQAGEYEDGVAGNSTWADGDWNCDGEFDSGDFVFALSAGGFTAAVSPAAVTSSPLPEFPLPAISSGTASHRPLADLAAAQRDLLDTLQPSRPEDKTLSAAVGDASEPVARLLLLAAPELSETTSVFAADAQVSSNEDSGDIDDALVLDVALAHVTDQLKGR